MKVLQVVHAFGPDSHGGTEAYVRSLAQELGRTDHEVEVLTGSPDGRERGELETSEIDGVKVHTLFRPGLYIDSWYHRYSPSAELLLSEVFRESAPDVVHVHQWMRLSSNLVQIAQEHGIPTVVTLHDTGTSCPRTFRVRNGSHCNRELSIENCFDCAERSWFQDDVEMRDAVRAFQESSVNELTLASQVMVLSESHRLAMEAYQPCLAGRIRVVPPPCMTKGVSPEKPTKATTAGPLRLAYWGALIPIKGLHLLLEAMGGLGPQQDVTLDVWGEYSSNDAAYKAQIDRLSARVVVRSHGSFEPQDIGADYDLAVFPSICHESYSFTVDEALSREIPVLVPAQGAPADRLQGRGDVFEAGDAQSLGRVLKRVCRDRSLLAAWRAAMTSTEVGASGFEDVFAVYADAASAPSVSPSFDITDIRRRAADLAVRLVARDVALWKIRGEAESVRGEVEGLEREVALREEIIEQREADLAEFEASLDATRELALRRQRDVESLEDEVKSARGESADHEAVFASLKETVSRQGRHLKTDAKRVEELVAHLESSGEALSEKNRLIGQYEKALRARELDIKRLEVEVTTLRDSGERENARLLDDLQGQLKDLTAREAKAKRAAAKGLERAREQGVHELEAAEQVHEEDLAVLRESHKEAIGTMRTEIETANEAHAADNETLNARICAAESESEVSRDLLLQEQMHHKETESSLAKLENELTEARERFEEELLDLRREIVDLERRSIRSEVVRSNLGDEQEASQQFIELQEEALAEVLAECQRLGSSGLIQDKALGRLKETLLPIAREGDVGIPEDASSEQIIDGAMANHTRLHGIIAERGGLISALEERLGQVSESDDFMLQAPSSETSRRLIERVRASAGSRPIQSLPPSRLRILFVVHDFLPRHAAGTEIYTYNLSQQLSQRHDVHLLFCEARHEQKRYTVSKGVIDGLPYTEVVHNYEWESFEETYHDPRMENIFAEVLEEVRPDLVHIQHLHYFSLNFPAMAKASGASVLYTLHEFLLLCPRGGQLLREDMEICEKPNPELCADCISHNRLAGNYGQEETSRKRQRIRQLLPKSVIESYERFTGPIVPRRLSEAWRSAYASAASARLKFIKESLKHVDLFVSPSAFLRQKFIDCEMIAPDRIIHSDNGFELGLFEGVERVESDTLRFGFVGTVAEYKGLHVLVEAFNAIDADGVELQIWGDLDTFEDYKQQLVSSINNSRIRTMGRFDNKRIAHVLSEIDVLIVPSLWFENSPLTIHEAWLAKIPVITSDIGGMAELVDDGVNGFHFRTGDALDLRDKVMRFISDRSLAARLSQAPGVVKEIGENAAELEGIYRQLMNGADPL